MARSRNIKPGFFKNEELADLPFEARLLFAGLWCLADRQGRLEDRPKRIKVDLFPYDDVDIDAMLWALHDHKLVVRYVVAEAEYIWIPKFHLHQNPHPNEKDSIIPPATEGIAKLRDKQCNSARTNVVAMLIPDSLSSDSLPLIPDSLTPAPRPSRGVGNPEDDAGFMAFWKAYPVKRDRLAAYKCWRVCLKAGVTPEQLMTALANYIEDCRRCNRSYKHASTFLGPSRPYEEYLKGVPESVPEPRGQPKTFHDQNADFLARKQQEAQRDGKP